jgi:hypothetical protein
MEIWDKDEILDELIHVRNTGVRTGELYRNIITLIEICRNRGSGFDSRRYQIF